MSELDRKSLEAFVTGETQRQQPRKNQQEEIRQQLLTHAQATIDRYQAEYAEALPKASEQLETVITPWWSDFQTSDIYREIVDILRHKVSFVLDINDPITYFWPRWALKELHEARELKESPFRYAAESVLEDHERQGKSIEDGIKGKAERYNNELWIANFHFSGLGDSHHRLYISRWPEAGAGFAFAMTASGYHINVEPPEPEGVNTKINPNVFIQFANQIQSDRVWQVLQQSVRGELNDR